MSDWLDGVHPTWRRLIKLYLNGVVASTAVEESVVPVDRIFHAYRFHGLINTKVVILGQDPYPRPGKANGLSFGLSDQWIADTGGADTSSFHNIRAEAERCMGDGMQDLTLESWAEQGVLMTNTRLTVAPNKPMSHAGMGWEPLVGAVLETLGARKTPVVFVAFGKEALKFIRKHVPGYHPVIHTPHPCKYSAKRGFIGSDVFTQINDKLCELGEDPIDWTGDYRSGRANRFRKRAGNL